MNKLKIILPMAWVLFAVACISSSPYESVNLEVQDSEAVTLEKVDDIRFLDFIVNVTGLDYNPTEQIRNYFCDEFAMSVKKKITSTPVAGWEKPLAGKDPAFSFASPEYFRTLLAPYPHAVFVTGKLTGEIKTTNVIRKVKDAKGEKRNVFVPQQIWQTEFLAVLIDADSGKVLAERVHKEKTVFKESVSPAFAYERLLEKITGKLQPDFLKKTRRGMRYLLLK